ncbi:MAG: methyltransferase domain-containing protein [Candidatus Latescibacteria bacterium]|nr:methyltransferase domain-containing protein [Candidatus Latescibacterota bacterium]
MKQSEIDIRRKEFFNNHADSWFDTFYVNSESGTVNRFEEKFSQLFDNIPLNEGDIVLDAGCGPGVLVPYILDRIGTEGQLFEVDYAEKMIAVNQRMHDDKRITFLVSSVEKLDISCGSIDAVICFSCFPHFQDKIKLLQEVRRILKHGSSLTIAHLDSSENINNRHSKHECVMHDHLPPEPEMRRLLTDAGFLVEQFIDESGFYCICAIAV